MISFGIFWFFITLSIESSIIPIKDVIFEHRLYLPSVGFILSATTSLFYGFGYLEKRLNRPLWNYLLAIIIIAAFALSFAAYKRNILWGDRYLMYLDNVSKAPNRTAPHGNLGIVYYDKGQYDRAIEEYNKAIALDQNLTKAYYNRGNAYNSKGQYERAIEDFNKAIALNPNYDKAYNNRGNAYDNKREYDSAIEDYNKAIALNPNYAEAYYNRGIAYKNKGQYDRAISDFQKACDMGLELGCKNWTSLKNK